MILYAYTNIPWSRSSYYRRRTFPEDMINSDVSKERALGGGKKSGQKTRKKHTENIKLLHSSNRPSSPSGKHTHTRAHNNTELSRISVETNDDERVPNGPKAFTIVLIRMCEYFFRTYIYLYIYFIV